MSGFGMYVKYLMAAFLVVFALDDGSVHIFFQCAKD